MSERESQKTTVSADISASAPRTVTWHTELIELMRHWRNFLFAVTLHCLLLSRSSVFSVQQAWSKLVAEISWSIWDARLSFYRLGEICCASSVTGWWCPLTYHWQYRGFVIFVIILWFMKLSDIAFWFQIHFEDGSDFDFESHFKRFYPTLHCHCTALRCILEQRQFWRMPVDSWGLKKKK